MPLRRLDAWTPTPELLSVARGESAPDLLLHAGSVVDVYQQRIERRDVVIHDGTIARVAPVGGSAPGGAREVIDADGLFIAPGFIDAHMHVESTMLPPSEFARLAVPAGTTSVIADPHEVANVLGVAGVRWMMQNALGLPLSFWWMLSSCVPSCHLETSGATISAGDLASLFADAPGPVVGLAEMMNYPGAANADPEVIAKLALGLGQGVCDGHAPGVTGDLLQAYAAAGISTDHECTTADEAREKLALGLRVWVREGSAARNLDAILPAITDDNFHRFGFCTDDRHPADLREQGHIDHIVRRAIARGMKPVRALALASTFTAEHYGLKRLGAVAPGRQADLVLFDDLDAPRPRLVVQRGRVVARDGVYLQGRRLLTSEQTQAVRLGRTVNIPPDLSAAHLRIGVKGKPADRVRVIGMHPHQLVTDHLTMAPRVESGAYVADPARDLLKLCVIERHTGSGRIGLGFVTGFRFAGGALASTVGHDAHNLAVVGDNDADMIAAARAVADAGGGQAVASRGRVLEVLKLPIAGLMSDQPAEEVIAAQARLLYAAHSLGCPHHDPFMPLSFLLLPVIPRLKLSDLGLVDVDRFEVVPLEV